MHRGIQIYLSQWAGRPSIGCLALAKQAMRASLPLRQCNKRRQRPSNYEITKLRCGAIMQAAQHAK